MRTARQVSPEQLSLFDDPPAQPAPVAVEPRMEVGVESPRKTKRLGRQPLRIQPAPAVALNANATLADVLAILEGNTSCERRHRDMKSALRRMGAVLRRPLVDIPADPAQLRPLLAKATPASVGMSKACWSRVRSLTNAVLRDLGIDIMPGRDVGARSPAWRAMADRLPNRNLQHGLSRFISHCSREGIEPHQVTAATFESYRAALARRSLKGEPEKAYRLTVALWNKAVAAVEEWPRVLVELKAHPRFYSLEWSDFPASFVADVEAFLIASGSTDELADDYVRAVRPGTTALRRRQLRQLASMLVASGMPIGQLESLAVLVEPANAKAVLKAERARQGQSSVSLGGKTWLLCVIARRWVKNAKAADELRKIACRLTSKQKGMTERNRDLLRQFDVKGNVTALLGLPDKVFRRAQAAKEVSAADANRVMLAVAVDILTVAPMRIDNLAKLDVTRHIVEFGRGRERNKHIIIPGEETKTGETFEVVLSPRTARFIDIYVSRFRHHVCPGASTYLFPNSCGELRCTTSFASAICKFVERETGLKMHVHLFRHLAGKLILQANPHGLETVRQLLQHKKSDTTARYYVDQKISDAYKRYDATLEVHRDPSSRSNRPPLSPNAGASR